MALLLSSNTHKVFTQVTYLSHLVPLVKSIMMDTGFLTGKPCSITESSHVTGHKPLHEDQYAAKTAGNLWQCVPMWSLKHNNTG